MSEYIHKSIVEVGLADQEGVFAKHLSGGQKRKLSIAIAMIGDPKVGYYNQLEGGLLKSFYKKILSP